ncbi:MAG: hypothetical protein E7Z90_06485 [Cyanobacteria bacterium SIG29]|nr:hypothetical protein [Cyanobacteria bacterium SIG29]
MATTNSANKNLNKGVIEREDNAGVEEWTITTTGNMEIKNGVPVLNNTYTLSSVDGEAEINGKLLDWGHGIGFLGSQLNYNFAYDKKVDDQFYYVYGHPNKWVYDYDQEYNNCGIDSSLNVLSIAGKKDIIEINSALEQYLSTPLYIRKWNEDIYNEETGTWEQVQHEEPVYPTRPRETEDAFLLWAIQNSQNDSKWYDTHYNASGEIHAPADAEIDDYVVHSKNYDTYFENKDKTEDSIIEFMKNNPTEQGGSTVVHRDNILKYWGLDTTAASLIVNRIPHKKDATMPSTPVISGPDENGMWTKTTITETTDDIGKKVTKTTVTEYYDKNPNVGESEAAPEVLKSVTVVEQRNNSNLDLYNFLSTLVYDFIAEGKGVILSGYATENYMGEDGGAHAITLVGALYGEVDKLKKTTTTKITGVEGELVTEEIEKQNDFLGVYVMDTGGFLGNNEEAQFITIEQLYNFLTDKTYEEGTIYSPINFTNTNIKEWADAMNLVGNDRKNSLEGNDSNNAISGKEGNDILWGLNGNDTLNGDNDQDTLYGGEGDDSLIGGFGNDTYIFESNGGSDVINDVYGSNNLQFDNVISSIDNLKFTNQNGNLVIEYDTNKIIYENYYSYNLFNSINQILRAENDGESIQIVEYRNFKDILQKNYINFDLKADETNLSFGSNYKDSIVGGNMNDTLYGLNENDIINGGLGNDSIVGGMGNDIIYASHGNDIIFTDAQNDKIIYESNFSGNDTIYGGWGEDFIEMSSKSKADLKYVRNYNNLVIYYDTEGNSITISNYFAAGGRTSIRGIYLSDGTVDLVNGYKNILEQAISGKSGYGITTGTDGYDYLTGTWNQNNTMLGGAGNDTLLGNNLDDTLNGGLGSDWLYGQGGNDTYIFDNNFAGEDTIIASWNGKTTLDFTGSGYNFTNKGVVGGIEEYSYTRVGGDLVINCAKTDAENGTKSVKILSFFYNPSPFEIINADGTTINLKDVAIYITGNKNYGSFVGGTTYNDSIIGYDFNDYLYGYNGNDTIVGGKGNDLISGGLGNNTYSYTKGDGVDTLAFSWSENATIKIDGYESTDKLAYDIVGANLDISVVDSENNKTKILTLQAFGLCDMTSDKGSVKLEFNGTTTDLRIGNPGETPFLAEVKDFTTNKSYHYGNWHTEIINATSLNDEAVVWYNRGAFINAAGGHDTITGSNYNDTLYGGDGDDVITTGYGVNYADGGNGNDTYKIFNISDGKLLNETTTINDYGWTAGDIDTVQIQQTKESLSTIWFNIDRYGRSSYITNVADSNNNTATLYGIEKIEATNGTYDLTSETLKSQVVSWLNTNNFYDVNTAKYYAEIDKMNELYAIFENNWQAV